MTREATQISKRRPTIGLTMGDPLGIGPEIVVKALADAELRRAARFVVYGMNDVLTLAADHNGTESFWYRVQHDSKRAKQRMTEDVIVRDYDEFDGLRRVDRRPTKLGGRSSKQFVEDAIADAMTEPDDPRHIDAVVTAPISKESWRMAGFKWPGHTELFTHRCRSKRSVMMFASPDLNVALATAHIPLMQVRDVLNIGRVFEPIDLGNDACRDLGIESPRIAVTGLNPHAGENGQFGSEEERIIAPAIQMAQDRGIDARGPYPADTVFNRAVAGEFDLVVAMYHDQGLIPVKLLAWEDAVNWTIGLPIVRTSPDHGTAFDIAGKNKASANSMTAAIRLAIKLAAKRVQKSRVKNSESVA